MSDLSKARRLVKIRERQLAAAQAQVAAAAEQARDAEMTTNMRKNELVALQTEMSPRAGASLHHNAIAQLLGACAQAELRVRESTLQKGSADAAMRQAAALVLQNDITLRRAKTRKEVAAAELDRREDKERQVQADATAQRKRGTP